MRTSFLPKAALQQAKNCVATLISCVAGKCRFPADSRLPRLGSQVQGRLSNRCIFKSQSAYVGGVPATPDRDASAKTIVIRIGGVCDAHGWCMYYFQPGRGHACVKVSRQKWEVLRDTLKASGSAVDATLLNVVSFGASFEENSQPFFCSSFVGTGKRGHYARGLFTGRISIIPRFSRISRKWSDSPKLCFPQSGSF